MMKKNHWPDIEATDWKVLVEGIKVAAAKKNKKGKSLREIGIIVDCDPSTLSRIMTNDGRDPEWVLGCRLYALASDLRVRVDTAREEPIDQ